MEVGGIIFKHVVIYPDGDSGPHEYESRIILLSAISINRIAVLCI